ncbi:MAG: hypothetical protein R6V19_03925 [Armatimonadota bacterium]
MSINELLLMAACIVLICAASSADENVYGEDRLTDLGVQCARNAVYNHATGFDADGEECYYMALTGQPGFLLALDPYTGEGAQYDFEGSPGHPWGIWWARNEKLYITLGGGVGDEVLCYDPATKEIENLGHATDTEIVVWTLWEAPDGKLYGGTYPNAKLVSIDLQTHEITDLGRIDPEEKYVRSVACAGRYIYCNSGPSTPGVWAYNIDTGQKTQILPERLRGGSGWGTARNCVDGNVYIPMPDEILRVDGLEVTTVEEMPEYVAQAHQGSPTKATLTLQDGAKIWLDSQSGPDARYFLLPPDGKQQTVSFEYEGTPNRLWSVVNGPDGRIYGSTHSPITLFAYDPATDETEVLGDPMHARGQVYGKLWHDGKLYMAAYGKSRVSVYDPSKPWNFGAKPDSNPRYLGSCHIGRPSALVMAPDGHNLLIGGVPGYGAVGGVLTIMSNDGESQEVIEGIVSEQSIYSMAAIPGTDFIAIGTTWRGGSASKTQESDARLLLWNYASREMVFETVPVPGEGMISQVLYHEGAIYGTTADGGCLFRFDLDTRKVTQSVEMGFGSGALFGLKYRESDGMLYAISGHSLLRVDPVTCEIERLCAHPELRYGLAFDEDAAYFCAGSHLMKCRLSGD